MTDLAATLEKEEARLVEERDRALAEVKKRPSGPNRKAYEKARAELDEFLKAKLEPVHAERMFSSLPDVLEFLQAEGWKISQSSLYEHRDSGKLKGEPVGGFALSAVQNYARAYLRKLDGTPGAEVSEGLSEQKLRAEITRIENDGKLRELKLRQELGELIAKSQVEVELAERANNLKSYFNAIARSSAGRIVKIVGGDQQKAPELISWMLGMFAKAFDNYSRPIHGTEEDE